MNERVNKVFFVTISVIIAAAVVYTSYKTLFQKDFTIIEEEATEETI